jgi:hypothetical protein
MWQHRSSPEQGGGVRCHGTCGSVKTLPSRVAGSGAAGHVAVCLAPCLGLKPVCGGTRSVGYRQYSILVG